MFHLRNRRGFSSPLKYSTTTPDSAIPTTYARLCSAAAKYVADFYSSDLYHAGGKYGYELVAMVLYNTIYGTFVDEDVTYAQAVASNWTSLTESEWNRLAQLARGTRTGTMVIFR